MIKPMTSKYGLFLFVAMALVSGLTLAEKPQMFPSAKYPDFPFSAAVSHNGVLYLSGDLGTASGGDLIAGGIVPETQQTMENIKSTLSHHGLDMSDIIKCTVFLADIAEWPDFNKVYVRYFDKGSYPARSALAASGLALGARVELECMAALREK